jgi:sugar/nucleoside kinase (ribokinase family)
VGEVDLKLLKYLKTVYPNNLCLDMQGFIRFRNEKEVFYSPLKLKEQKEIISGVNILKVDQTEAEILTNEKKISSAAAALLEFGPKEVLITHEDGISVYSIDFSCYYPWKNKSSPGRTGRGDTAFISYLGSRISSPPEDSLRFAAALTSLKLESPGPFNLPRHQVESLIKKEY